MSHESMEADVEEGLGIVADCMEQGDVDHGQAGAIICLVMVLLDIAESLDMMARPRS